MNIFTRFAAVPRNLMRLHSNQMLVQSRLLNTTPVLLKVRKAEKEKSKKTNAAIQHAGHENMFVQDALKEMNEMQKILSEELTKHFSIQVDIRLFEDIVVKLEKGDEHKMSRLGRVSLKNPQMVMINFADNPTAIKWAKLALQKSTLSVNPQHEGVVLYIPMPRMTRERREQLANDAKGKIFNDYKKALNEIYTRIDKKSTQATTVQDELKRTREELLSLKRAMETRGNEIVEKKRKELLQEVV